MKLKEFKITLDLKKNNQTGYIEVVQNDNQTNVINIKLVDGINDYVIDSTTEVVFLKSDGSIYTEINVTTENNLIRCVLDSDVISEPGMMLSEVRVLSGDIILTTGQFKIYVRKSIY